jgi:hypothetical protein
MTTRRIKKCNRCKAALDASEFHRNLAAKDGLQGRCKQCHVKGNAKYRSGRKLRSLSDMGYKNALADMDQAFEAAGFSDHARDNCESAIRARGARAEREKWGKEKDSMQRRIEAFEDFLTAVSILSVLPRDPDAIRMRNDAQKILDEINTRKGETEL